MTLQSSFKNLADAGKAYGAEHGYFGKSGGWIYREAHECGSNPHAFDLPICQGWLDFGRRLKSRGKIHQRDDGRFTIQ